MPSEAEIESELQSLEEVIERTGAEVVDQIQDTTPDGSTIRGRIVKHGGHHYNLIGNPDNHCIVASFAFNAVELIAGARAQQAAAQATGQAPPAVQIQPDKQTLEETGEELRDSVRGKDELRDIRQGLIDRLSEPGVAATLMADEEFAFGFDVQAKFYVYDRDYTPAEYDEKAQTVVSLGWKGKEYLVNQYDIHGLVDIQPDSPGPSAVP